MVIKEALGVPIYNNMRNIWAYPYWWVAIQKTVLKTSSSGNGRSYKARKPNYYLKPGGKF